jgi:hypothetical protein
MDLKLDTANAACQDEEQAAAAPAAGSPGTLTEET